MITKNSDNVWRKVETKTSEKGTLVQCIETKIQMKIVRKKKGSKK